MGSPAVQTFKSSTLSQIPDFEKTLFCFDEAVVDEFP
jgi:hypothetical protein